MLAADVSHRSFLETRHYPPRSSILYPSLDLQQAMGTTQLHSSSPAAKRCVWLRPGKHKTADLYFSMEMYSRLSCLAEK